MKKLSDEEQQALRADLAPALDVYNWKAGRDPDTPEGQRRLVEELRASRAGAKDNTGPRPTAPEAVQEIEVLPNRPQELERPRKKQHRTRLSKALEELRERWRALPFETQRKIGLPPGEFQEHPDGTKAFVPLEPSDADLIAAVDRIHGAPGRPEDASLDLLKVIVELWPDYSPDRGIVRHGSADYFDERYAGPMLDFTLQLLDSHAIPYRSRGAIGERLYDLAIELELRPKKSRQEKPPPKSH
jgi:hypothetical protein